jgi:CubicO group peptidase (beta-lactamase class C family)
MDVTHVQPKNGWSVSLCHTYTSYSLKKYENENILTVIVNSILQFIRPTNTIRFNDPQVHQLIKDFDIPGLSIAVVRNDSVFSKGYGNLEIHKERKVDENTIFWNRFNL